MLWGDFSTDRLYEIYERGKQRVALEKAAIDYVKPFVLVQLPAEQGGVEMERALKPPFEPSFRPKAVIPF